MKPSDPTTSKTGYGERGIQWNSRRKASSEFIVVGIYFAAGRYEYSARFILRARRFLARHAAPRWSGVEG